ncbi:hypothetical protein H6P81_008971 [Aristolochia fimbriata]|uniref:Uncharacterized protein n=1 Tax=Aristolochia fimbriata TaxID=158543 RepID=A0AAV7EM96_ARIFI|nr:hypothetical protein H6P81_008971 [Aristolochia fimbriata]
MKRIAMMSDEVAGEFVFHVAAKPANCASSSSKEAEKIAIEEVTSGHTIDLGSTDDTSEVNGETDVSAAEPAELPGQHLKSKAPPNKPLIRLSFSTSKTTGTST